MDQARGTGGPSSRRNSLQLFQRSAADGRAAGAAQRGCEEEVARTAAHCQRRGCPPPAAAAAARSGAGAGAHKAEARESVAGPSVGEECGGRTGPAACPGSTAPRPAAAASSSAASCSSSSSAASSCASRRGKGAATSPAEWRRRRRRWRRQRPQRYANSDPGGRLQPQEDHTQPAAQPTARR